MTPELKILIVNAVFMAFAYFWVYPPLADKKVSVILRYDAIISAAALLVAGLLFWGSDVQFSLIYVDVNWVAFSIITLILFEIPLSLWFIRRYDISL